MTLAGAAATRPAEGLRPTTPQKRSRDNVMLVEEYLARETGGANPLEAGAPPAAGGAL